MNQGTPPLPTDLKGKTLLFVTGRLASESVTTIVQQLAAKFHFQAEILTLGISVAALMHVDWLLRKLPEDLNCDLLVLPGWVQGDLTRLEEHVQVACLKGPKNILDLPEFFQSGSKTPADLSTYDIEIIAEINHAPRLPVSEIILLAESFAADGANVIDLGCIPGSTWNDVSLVVGELIARDLVVSIDSFNEDEVTLAVDAGASLVLSCNHTNLAWACQLDVEWVVIPDDIHDITTMHHSIEQLASHGRRFRIDPILEPIGFGFAASLQRYAAARQLWPDLPMMMGIGNLTELTEADTSGMNLLLAGFCQELGIQSVLTTQVINWARTAIKEFDFARRQAWHAIHKKTLPKHLSSDLVMLRDPKRHSANPEQLEQFARQIKDPNYRIAVSDDALYLLNRDGFWTDSDPFDLFQQAIAAGIELDSSHAFYLGYELCKARTALTLGKNYVQDEALSWGFLTCPEKSIHDRDRPQFRHSATPQQNTHE